MTLRVGTFCSGIGAPELAWSPLGFKPQWFSEIDPFASAVLAHRFPNVPNLGDMKKVNPSDLPDADIWAAGTPCQSFSIGGLRGSLGDARGNLCLTFVRLVHERDPEFVIWENVPGVLSTIDNAFGCFLAGMVGASEPVIPRTSSGKWSRAGMVCGPRRAAAWRVLDAQYIAVAGDSAVPQRRARVFVVSRNFRNLGRLETSSPQRNADRVCGLLAEIIFEPESLPRHTSPRGETGTDVAENVAGCLNSGGNQGGFRTEPGEYIVAAPLTQNPYGDHESRESLLIPEAVGTLSDGAHHGGGLTGKTPTVDALSRCLNAGGMGRQDFETETLIPVIGDGFDASEDGTGRGTPLVPVAFNWQAGGTQTTLGYDPDSRVSGSLHVGQTPAVCIPFGTTQITNPRWDVRRLTVVECARLMGFPDDHCRIPWRGKPAELCPDGPQYKAYGNAIVIKELLWLGKRLLAAHAETAGVQ